MKKLILQELIGHKIFLIKHLRIKIFLAVFAFLVATSNMLFSQDADIREKRAHELHMEALNEEDYDKAMAKYKELIDVYSDTEYYKYNSEGITSEMEQREGGKFKQSQSQKEERIKKGLIDVGMITYEVSKSWGYPDETKMHHEGETSYEIWIYKIYGKPSKYVIFKDFWVESYGFGDYKDVDLFKKEDGP